MKVKFKFSLIYCHVYEWQRRGLDWQLDLLNSTYLQVTIALSLIHALYNSLQHILSLLSPLCLHQPLSGNGNQRCSLLSFHVHALTGPRLFPNKLNSVLLLLVTSQHGPHRKHRFQQFYCCVTHLSHGLRRKHSFPISLLVHVRNLLPSNRSCLQSHYLATGLHAATYEYNDAYLWES
jgi:hypothetical protein